MARVVKQISVFLEHRPGSLADFCSILQRAGIDMRALSLAKATDFGVARVVVDKLEEAEEALKKAGRIFSITQVIEVVLHDKPGTLYSLLALIKDAGINIKYCYSVSVNEDGKARMLVRVDDSDIERTLALLD